MELEQEKAREGENTGNVWCVCVCNCLSVCVCVLLFVCGCECVGAVELIILLLLCSWWSWDGKAKRSRASVAWELHGFDGMRSGTQLKSWAPLLFYGFGPGSFVLMAGKKPKPSLVVSRLVAKD